MVLKYLMDENVDPVYTKYPSIFILSPNLSVGQNLEELILLAEYSFDNEHQDQIIHLPIN